MWIHATLCALVLQQAEPQSLVEVLPSLGEVKAVNFEGIDPRACDVLVWTTACRELPAAARQPETVKRLRSFVEGGGGVLLISHAVAWLQDLGLEPVAPNRCDTRLIGHSDHFAGGRYEYGLRVTDPEHVLFRGLTPEVGRADSFLLVGGHSVRLQCCYWDGPKPRAASMLGTWYRNSYGEVRVFGDQHCLVERALGKGRIVAYGAGPLPFAGNPHSENLRRFIQNCLGYLGYLGYLGGGAKGDPIPRPARYWGSGFDPNWSAKQIVALTALAHDRGFLVHRFHHPNPVRGSIKNFVSFAERCARDFANPLRGGWRKAWDGLGSEWAPADRKGLITEAIWRYNPGAYQHSTAVLPAYTPNFSATMMCAFGRLGRINACGYSDQWQARFLGSRQVLEFSRIQMRAALPCR